MKQKTFRLLWALGFVELMVLICITKNLWFLLGLIPLIFVYFYRMYNMMGVEVVLGFIGWLGFKCIEETPLMKDLEYGLKIGIITQADVDAAEARYQKRQADRRNSHS